MYIDPVYVDIDVLVFIKRNDIIINSQEPKYKGKHNSQHTYNKQLFPRQPNSFQNTLQELNFSK